MLLNAGLMFGLFLLCSLYLQLVLGHGPLATGLAFIPLALAAGAGAHLGGQLIQRHGVRRPVAAALTLAAGGLYLLSRVGEHGTYLHDVLPGMLIAGFSLGLAGVSVSVAVLTGARAEESGMLSGVNATGHEIGGTLGIAVFTSIAAAVSGGIAGPTAATGIADAFLVAAHVALAAGAAALLILPAARTFLPKLRLSPQAVPTH
jgi:MFS family permease